MQRRGKRSQAKEDSSSSSSGEEVELDLNEDGRVRVSGLNVRPFRSFPKIIAEAYAARLIPDAKETFNARATKKGAKYSAGNTFWLAADATPTCTLEMLARQIFTYHSAGAAFDPLRSGAEWWTQVLQPDDSIGLHWDKDYPLEEHGLNLCPHIATVTNAGGPTIVLEKAAPPLSSDPVAGSISRAFLSRPLAGKHMAFDGYLLHGAPAELSSLFASHPPSSTPRVTFLVNVWLNHKPTNSIALPAALRKKLSKDAPEVDISNQSLPTICTSFNTPVEAKPFVWTFAASEDAPFALRFPQPKAAKFTSEAVELHLPAGNVADMLALDNKETKHKKSRKK